MINSLQCDTSIADGYQSATQIARVVSECWCSENLYCAACTAERLEQAPANTRALDFRCRTCSETYQIKSQRQLNLTRIVDGAYSAMIAAVQKNLAPNLLILHYSQNWTVRNLVLVPSVFLTESVVVQRAPLSAAARRSGWIGCNLALKNVPPDGKIHLVQNDAIIPSSNIREIYKKFQKLEAVDWKLRGWTFDVLRVARKLAKTEFSLKEVYKFESELASLHPQNNNIKAKVRQQLQVLRDMGILEFLQPGRYCFKA